MIHCKECGLLTHGIDGFCSCCLEAIGGPRTPRESAERIYLSQIDNLIRAEVQAIQATLSPSTMKIDGLLGGSR